MPTRLSSLLEWCNCFALAIAERMGNYRTTAGFGQNVSTFRFTPATIYALPNPVVFLGLASVAEREFYANAKARFSAWPSRHKQLHRASNTEH